jgi:hypothetical protein
MLNHNPDLRPEANEILQLSWIQVSLNIRCSEQCCGSGSGLDPDLMGSPDPDCESGSGSLREKMTHKNRKKLINFMF